MVFVVVDLPSVNRLPFPFPLLPFYPSTLSKIGKNTLNTLPSPG